jgi:catechol 2,3-dioxygenase-like lactoylglutathione lyase family enzyme
MPQPAQMLSSEPVLAVRDMVVSADWYARVLGCVVYEPDTGWRFCRNGHVTFRLGECADALPASEIGDHSYVAYLTVDDVDAFHAHAVEAGADIRRPPTDESWGRREMWLHSPDGHRFILGQRLNET